jgi:hypothetical protein
MILTKKRTPKPAPAKRSDGAVRALDVEEIERIRAIRRAALDIHRRISKAERSRAEYACFHPACTCGHDVFFHLQEDDWRCLAKGCECPVFAPKE